MTIYGAQLNSIPLNVGLSCLIVLNGARLKMRAKNKSFLSFVSLRKIWEMFQYWSRNWDLPCGFFCLHLSRMSSWWYYYSFFFWTSYCIFVIFHRICPICVSAPTEAFIWQEYWQNNPFFFEKWDSFSSELRFTL